MYKLVAIDLDGTLLNSYGQINEENINTIKQLNQKGIYVVLASGRAKNSIINFANELEIKNFIIAGNGSLIYDMQQEKVIYDKFMEKNKVLDIVNICEENSMFYSVSLENSILAKSMDYIVKIYNNENINKPDNKKTNINITENIYKYIYDSDVPKYSKITICDKDKIIFSSIIKKLRTIKDIDVLDVEHEAKKKIKIGTEIVPIEYYYTEITKKGVNKWEALQFLINTLGITKQEIITIGDNVNDIEMIKTAGIGVAMGNSAPQIKEIADVVLEDNNTNTISEFLKNKLLI